MKIGILQTGRVPEELAADHKDYDALFRDLLSGQGFEFETWKVLDGDCPSDPHAADGWLVTGSKHGAYEAHPWIAPLEDLLRAAFASDVPIIGVCFGHQVLAQALGGKVEKFAGGWAIGLRDYDNGDRLVAWHQDQVVTPPPGAVTLASNPHCAHAMLAYGKTALSVQPHPEYGPDFIEGLMRLRGHLLPEGMVAEETARLRSAPLTASRYAQVFGDFFRHRRQPGPVSD